MTDEQRLDEIEKHMERLQQAYIDDYMEVTLQKGFDEYSPKWNKKLEKVAEKYVDYMAPLTEEYNAICDKLDKLTEEERKKKYKDVD